MSFEQVFISGMCLCASPSAYGRGALSAAVLGSVSHYALNHSNVPVLIVRSEGEDAPEPKLPAEATAAA